MKKFWKIGEQNQFTRNHLDKNNIEQQQEVKNNAELQTKWTNTAWNIFEKTIRLGRNKSIKGRHVTDDDDGDVDDGEKWK